MKLRFVLAAALAALFLVSVGAANARPVPADDNQSTVAAKTRTQDLGTLQVTGERRKILRMVKIGLHTPISTDPAARDVVVCQLKYRRASHIKQIVCATTKTWLARAEATATALAVSTSGVGGMSLHNFVQALNRRSSSQGFAAFKDPSQIMADLKQLPAVKKDDVVRMMREIKH